MFYKRANEDNSQNPLWQYMLEYYAGRYMELAKEKLGTDALDKDTAFSIRLYSYGTIAMSREWAFGNGPTPAEEEVELMYQSLPCSMLLVATMSACVPSTW